MRFEKVVKQKKLNEQISSGAQEAIQEIINGLTTAKRDTDKKWEIEMIRQVCRSGTTVQHKAINIDLYLEAPDGEMYLIDIKTAKPNMDGFKGFKRTLLEWAAIVLYDNPEAQVNTLIAIPYNPDAPKPYNRWTIRGMLDLGEELKVAEEFWDFLGGEGVYGDLLQCFERVGVEMKSEIDDRFAQFR